MLWVTAFMGNSKKQLLCAMFFLFSPRTSRNNYLVSLCFCPHFSQWYLVSYHGKQDVGWVIDLIQQGFYLCPHGWMLLARAKRCTLYGGSDPLCFREGLNTRAIFSTASLHPTYCVGLPSQDSTTLYSCDNYYVRKF